MTAVLVLAGVLAVTFAGIALAGRSIERVMGDNDVEWTDDEE